MQDLQTITDEDRLEDILSEPYPEDVALARRLEGDVMILGAGGKMGPTLVRRIVQAVAQAGASTRVYAVSRFSDAEQRAKLDACGAETISADLLDEAELQGLPRCRNLIYLVGMKFGSTGQQPLTWAMNTYLPGRVAETFPESRIVALSTGNVYGPVPVAGGGSREADAVNPVGEYAQSCLGRERILQHFARRNETPMCLIRLNYAVEPRYGVLLDIASSVHAEEPVSLGIGHVNVVWQGYANSVVFRALELCTTPADILNLTGPETLSVRALATFFGERFGRPPVFQGDEGPTALLNDASRCLARFGLPDVDHHAVAELVADWVERGGATHGKPTKFEVRDGKF